MIYQFFLKVAGTEYQVVEHDVRLFSSLPGTASFRIASGESLTGSVLFSFSVNNQQRHSHFYGYVERSTKATDNTYVLFCREMFAALDRRLPVSFRNTSVSDVLSDITRQTDIEFSYPSNTYINSTIPYFTHTGTGVDIVRSLGLAFNIENFVCQQRRDGTIWVGRWEDGQWPNNEINLPATVFTKVLSTDKAEVMAIPGLRPNFVLNGRRIYNLTLIGLKMVISWTKP